MFKIIREDKEIEEWDIVHIESNKVVAKIIVKSGYKWQKKKLYVLDKEVCDIQNQKEALVKLEEFFFKNKRETENQKNFHRELLSNLNVVEGHYTYNLILKEIKAVEEKISELEQYNLI